MLVLNLFKSKILTGWDRLNGHPLICLVFVILFPFILDLLEGRVSTVIKHDPLLLNDEGTEKNNASSCFDSAMANVS